MSVRIAALSREDRADQESSANVDPGIGRIHAQQRHVTPHETNHFVRLHPSTARKLYDDAVLTLVPTSRSPDFTRSVDGWDLAETVISSRCSSGVEFLPLEIQRSNGDLVYASYNGGDCLGMCWNCPLSPAGAGRFESMIESVRLSLPQNASYVEKHTAAFLLRLACLKIHVAALCFPLLIIFIYRKRYPRSADYAGLPSR